MLEITIDKDLCNGCAYCVLACPTECMEFDYNTMKPYVRDIGECLVCRNCEEQCPMKIIEVRLPDYTPKPIQIGGVTYKKI